jgi:secreted trypsin-like serine protease
LVTVRTLLTTLSYLVPLLGPPALALEGGSTLTAGQTLSRSTVAIQAVTPLDDGKARVSECTGILVARDLVLTAAHCLDDVLKPEHVAVFFFEGSKAVAPFAPVAAIVRHPSHVRGWAKKPGDIETRQAEISNDLALLRLRAPAASDRPVFSLDSGLKPNALVLFAAGASGPGGKTGTLKTIALSSIRHTQTGPQLAFATPGVGRVCTGDSGGPVVTQSGAIWGVAGAILRGEGGCSSRMVVVPVNSETISGMMRIARGG